MEPLAMSRGGEARNPAAAAAAGVARTDAGARSDAIERRISQPPRSSRAPGMGLGHEVLLALIMALAMAGTVFLYR